MKIDNEQLLTAYISNNFNQTKTAKTLGTTKQTINRKIQNPEFQKLLKNYRANLFKSASQDLLENTVKASKTLARLLSSKSENIRLQAACKILNLSCDYVTIDDLQQELDSLKETINKE